MDPFIKKLYDAYESEKDEHKRIRILAQITWQATGDDNPDTALMLAEQVMELSTKLSDGSFYKIGYGYGLMNKGTILSQLGKPDGKLFTHQAHDIFVEVQDILGLAESNIRLANLYWYQGELDKGLAYCMEAHKYAKISKDEQALAWSSFLLATQHFDLGDYQSSREYFLDSLKYFESIESTTGILRAQIGLADVCYKNKNYIHSVGYLRQAENLALTQSKNNRSISRIYNDLGKNYLALNDTVEARINFSKALELRNTPMLMIPYITTLTDICHLYIAERNWDQALSSAQKAVELSIKYTVKTKEYTARKVLSEIYKYRNEPYKALEELEHYSSLRLNVLGDENEAKLKGMKMSFEVDKSRQEAEIERLRNVELRAAYERIDKINQDLTASINYAKRIQLAILPETQMFDEVFMEYFILYRPKNIVSGDFYYIAHRDGKVVLSIADCTGHGVPGAFMTLMGNDFFNIAILEKGYTDPSKILSEIDERIRVTLRQDENHLSPNDGMDVGVLMVDPKRREIKYSAAKHYLVAVFSEEIIKIKGSRFPLGSGQFNDSKDFVNEELHYQSGDVFYMFTDGYADQFGGPECRKFMSKRLLSMLREIQSLSMSDQKMILEQQLDSWKGNEPQTDDILVVGFRMK